MKPENGMEGDRMAEKKKLMLISPMLHQGGFERVCITTARLMEPYFDVTIVIFNSANIAYDVEGLKIIDLNLGVRKGKIKKILNIIKRSCRVRRLKKEMKPEIAYSFGPTANMVNAFSKTKETKVWLGLRNYTDVEEKVKIKLFTRLADLIICCSKTIENELKIKFKFNKTSTLYNLYDVKSIRKEAESKEPDLPWAEVDKEGRKIRCLVSMGRDDDMKGFWHMLKVFSLIHERIPETRLILLGAGTFEKYRKLAKELKIEEAVFFAGMQKEPYKYLKKGEVYLLTSLNEGFPNALVEGMTLGLAAVSVDCMTGPAEILLEDGDTSIFEQQKQDNKTQVIYGEYGILVPVMSKERNLDAGYICPQERAMAEIVVDLMMDSSKLKTYQEAAQRRAQIFTYEHYVEQFLRLADCDND
ncbi:MAG: glycosyltransferase [Firmicutes bacterium]|nr:glycosyltransferase [Bacillota bacterium]